jgi:hypothetical protein
VKTNAETLKAKTLKAAPVGFRVTTIDSSEGWSLSVVGILPHGFYPPTVIVDNDYTRRLYSSAGDAMTAGRHAISRFNTPKLGLKKDKA